MARINDETEYPEDTNISGDENLIGSDSDTNKTTRNFSINSIADHTNTRQLANTTNGKLLMKDDTGVVDSSVTETDDAVESSKSIQSDNGFMYFGDRNTDGSWRVRGDVPYLQTERRDNGVWVSFDRKGGSTVNRGFIEMTQEPRADLLVNDGTNVRNLIRSAVTQDGVVVGDVYGDTFLVTADKFPFLKLDAPLQNFVFQAVDTATLTGTSFRTDITTRVAEAGTNTRLTFRSPNPFSSSNRVQVRIWLQSEFGQPNAEPFYTNVTDEEFANGIGAKIDTNGHVILKPAFVGVGTLPIILEYNFTESLTLNGDNSGAIFQPYLESIGATLTFFFPVMYEEWKEKTYAVGDKIWQNGDVYFCNTAGAQTGDFASNASLWDELYDLITSQTAGSGSEVSNVDLSVSGNELSINIEQTGSAPTRSDTVPLPIRSDEQIQDVIGAMVTGNTETGIDVTYNDTTGKLNFVVSGTTPPQATHTHYLAVTTDNQASSVDTGTAETSDDLNPTFTIPTYTEDRYLQILQTMAHSRFTSINIGGLNQIGAFTITDDVREIGGQQYRQYVSTNLLTDALSGDTVILGGSQ